jgi:sulfur carrier protein
MSDTTTLRVLINQAPHELWPGATLADAVQHAGIQPPFAAAVNLQFVPRSQYAQHTLAEHDQIELISPITGG